MILSQIALRSLAMLAIATLVASCNNRQEGSANDAQRPPTQASAPTVTQPANASANPSRSVSLIDLLPECDVDDDGLVIDLGNPTADSALGAGTRDPSIPAVVERGGASLKPIHERRFSQEFWLDDPAETLLVRARVIGHGATFLSASVDGRRLGRIKLTKNEAATITFPRLSEPVAAGRHILLLEAQGRASGNREPLYDIDWLNFGRSEEPNPAYSPATSRDLIADQELDGIPKRSIVLRSSTQIRCPLHLATGARLELSLGFWGTGNGTAEIGIVEEGQSKTTLHERKITGGVGSRWTPVNLDLTPYAGRIVALELRAARATQGGRIAFGEPKLRRTLATAHAPAVATTVVVVVAAGLERRLLPPWGPVGDNTAFAELQRDAVAFHGYRVPTTVPAGVMTTLLTGLSPQRHHVDDTAARFGAALHPLSQVFKQAGARTAMFTAVPTTFPAFGFNVGWDDYGYYSPVLDLPADASLVEATRWLGQRLEQNRNGVRLLLVHLRGAHPPWDITREQAAQLAPADYAGSIDARRGGVVLGKIRRQTTKTQRRLNDDDTQRLTALMQAALAKQNAALAALMAALKRRDAWDDTLFILMGDVSNADLPNLPFDPIGSLREDQLTVPLLVKFPRRDYAGTTFDRPVTTVDLTHTILDAAHLAIPETVEGISLLDSLAGNEPLLTRTLVSTLGQRYVARTGVWLLSGEPGRLPKLCQTDVDPVCVEDQFGKRPLTARTLYRWTLRELSAAQRAAEKTQREPASIDAETAAALTVWGDVEL